MITGAPDISNPNGIALDETTLSLQATFYDRHSNFVPAFNSTLGSTYSVVFHVYATQAISFTTGALVLNTGPEKAAVAEAGANGTYYAAAVSTSRWAIESNVAIRISYFVSERDSPDPLKDGYAGFFPATLTPSSPPCGRSPLPPPTAGSLGRACGTS